MFIRCAYYEGDVAEANRARFETLIREQIAPAIRKFPSTRMVRTSGAASTREPTEASTSHSSTATTPRRPSTPRPRRKSAPACRARERKKLVRLCRARARAAEPRRRGPGRASARAWVLRRDDRALLSMDGRMPREERCRERCHRPVGDRHQPPGRSHVRPLPGRPAGTPRRAARQHQIVAEESRHQSGGEPLPRHQGRLRKTIAALRESLRPARGLNDEPPSRGLAELVDRFDDRPHLRRWGQARSSICAHDGEPS